VAVGISRPNQTEAYKSVLIRAYELLTDPKPSRFSGYRAAQLRKVAAELRRLCAHPALADTPPPQSTLPDDDDLEATLADSAKLALVDSMLSRMHTKGQRAMLFAHSSRVLDLLERCVTQRFGEGSASRIDVTTGSADRRAAVDAFNADGSPAFVFVMQPKACGLGTDLPSVNAVIFFDSDWSVSSDLMSLSHARRVGNPGELRVYRVYCLGTLEEGLLALSGKMKGLEGSTRQSHGRAYSASAKAFEEVLRWGAEGLFAGDTPVGAPTVKEEQPEAVPVEGSPVDEGEKPDTETPEGEGTAAATSAEAPEPAGSPSVPVSGEMTGAADKTSAILSEDVVEKLLAADPVAVLAAHGPAPIVEEGAASAVETNPCVLAPGLDMAVVVDLSSVKSSLTEDFVGDDGKQIFRSSICAAAHTLTMPIEMNIRSSVFS